MRSMPRDAGRVEKAISEVPFRAEAERSGTGMRGPILPSSLPGIGDRAENQSEATYEVQPLDPPSDRDPPAHLP